MTRGAATRRRDDAPVEVRDVSPGGVEVASRPASGRASGIGLAVASMTTVQLGYALSQPLFERIGAAAKINGLSYNQLINGLKQARVELDRKILAEIAVADMPAFGQLAQTAKSHLGA